MKLGLPGVADEVDRIGRDVADAVIVVISNQQTAAGHGFEAGDEVKHGVARRPAVAGEAAGSRAGVGGKLAGRQRELEDLTALGDEQVARVVEGDVPEAVREVDVGGLPAARGRIRAAAGDAGDDAGGGVDAADGVRIGECRA